MQTEIELAYANGLADGRRGILERNYREDFGPIAAAYERGFQEGRQPRSDLVQAIMVAIEPKFRGMGGGDIPRQIAYEVARTAVAAIAGHLSTIEEQAFERGQASGASPHDGSWPTPERSWDSSQD